MGKEDIHIGSIIRKKLKEQAIRVIDFADAIHCERTNVYSIFSRKSIDIDLLLLISKTLDYNFISEYYCKEPTDGVQRVILEIETTELELQKLLAEKSIKVNNLWKVSK